MKGRGSDAPAFSYAVSSKPLGLFNWLQSQLEAAPWLATHMIFKV
jgi:hypothetical protein